MKIKVTYVEDFIVEADKNWGDRIEVDPDEWRKFLQLKKEFFELNGKFYELARASGDRALEKRPKRGHARKDCPNGYGGAYCGDCIIEGNEVMFPWDDEVNL